MHITKRLVTMLFLHVIKDLNIKTKLKIFTVNINNDEYIPT
jgi:hypothetical protein